ncbi:MAG TPA: sulfite exporter TauE/SafE family protein [Corynebacterium stationis]|nr:sulfite exporter TauE/SafE family protein [Corynebacterium stationis]
MEMIAIGAILALGACVQGAIGFGLGMMAAPLIALIAPEQLPGTVLLLAFALSFATFFRERGQIQWSVVGWASLGRVPGSLLGALLVAVLPTAGLSLVLAVAVILGIVVSLVGWSPGYGRRSAGIAGVAAGVLGTATSIGGPPLALILRGLPPSAVRGTMGAAFVIGTALSIIALWAGGSLDAEQWRASLVFLPAIGIGFLLSGLVNRYVDSRHLYVGSVVLSLIGAAVVIVNSLQGLLG